MARLAQQRRRIERDVDEPGRALLSRLCRRLGRIQSSMLSSRAAADLSLRAPPVLDRSRRDNARGPIPLRWLNRSALALGHAGYPVRKHLQLATFWVSRRPPHLRHAGAAHDGGSDRLARGGTPT